jgi:hypothetical protein
MKIPCCGVIRTRVARRRLLIPAIRPRPATAAIPPTRPEENPTEWVSGATIVTMKCSTTAVAPITPIASHMMIIAPRGWSVGYSSRGDDIVSGSESSMPANCTVSEWEQARLSGKAPRKLGG